MTNLKQEISNEILALLDETIENEINFMEADYPAATIAREVLLCSDEIFNEIKLDIIIDLKNTSCVTIGFEREDGDFRILATLNNNDGELPSHIWKKHIISVARGYAARGIDIMVLRREDVSDYLYLSDDEINNISNIVGFFKGDSLDEPEDINTIGDVIDSIKKPASVSAISSKMGA